VRIGSNPKTACSFWVEANININWLYLSVALVLSLGFVVHGFKLWRKYSDEQASQTFKFSLVHLSVLFAAMLIDHYLFDTVNLYFGIS
jgi:heme O synthase-like polyprenyltransferase